MVTLYDYLAYKTPNEAYQVMIDSGLDLPNPRSSKQLANMLKRFVRKGGEDAIRALAQIHPDKDLIESLNVEKVKEQNKDFGENNIDKVTLNADGGCGCGGHKHCGCGGHSDCGCGGGCKCNEKNDSQELNFCPSCSLAFDGKMSRRSNANFAYFNADGATNNNNSGGMLQSRAHEILIGVGVLGIAVALIIKASK